ncbi:MAG: DMT family transporter [Polyangiaceae bacterium]|nr:DMT family transporter [Polyangiaceae bacterium]
MTSLTPGMRHMLLGVFFFSVMSAFTKAAGARLPAAEIVFARAVITLVLSIIAIRRLGAARFGTQRGLLVTRGIYGFIALSCLFFSLTRLPLADATVLQFTNPIVTAFLAVLLLRERMGLVEVLGGIVCIAGVVFVARPTFLFGEAGAIDGLAVAVALVGATFSALAYVTVRKLGTSEEPMVVVFYFALVALPGSLAFLAIGDPVLPHGHEWFLLLGVGVFAQLGQVELTRGLRLEPAARASSANYVQVLFAYAWGMLFFDEQPSFLGIIGAVLIACGSLRVNVRRAPHTDPRARSEDR